MARCGSCQRSFRDEKSLKQHFKMSSRHAWCDTCQLAFDSLEAKTKHLQSSSAHSRCFRRPEQPEFKTRDYLRIHLKSVQTAAQPIVSDALLPAKDDRYIGVPKSEVRPVFAVACRLRFVQPQADHIISLTNTSLDSTIVSALIEAAVRLLPPERSPLGIEARQERSRKRAEQARRAEEAFVTQFVRLGYQFQTEIEQKATMNVTPDIRFYEPVLVCGHLCHWLEYKNYFGFAANPFVASKNKKQLKKYAANIGPGAVVYTLGFEIGHLVIDGVKAMREVEVLASLTDQTIVPSVEAN